MRSLHLTRPLTRITLAALLAGVAPPPGTSWAQSQSPPATQPSPGPQGPAVARTSGPPAPGLLIDLGGYRFHLWCTGAGAPAVVLSAGSGDCSFDWALVQPTIAKLTRVCSYDRGGEAWSDLGPAPRTKAQEVFDLRRALVRAGVMGPYVLVGHSMGGEVVRMFAVDHLAEVAGMVLVDSGHEEDTVNLKGTFTTLRAISKGRPIPPPRSSVTEADGLDAKAVETIEESVRNAGLTPKIEEPYDRLPADVQALQLWAMGQPKHWAATSIDYAPEEAERLYQIDHRTERPFGAVPLVVLSQDMSGRTDEHALIHVRTQQMMAHYSTRGRQIVVPGSGHHIQLEHPDAVIAAIEQVLEAARHRSAPPPRPGPAR
jgi:pimeloyl-ACP methyl ester carboxylesterase